MSQVVREISSSGVYSGNRFVIRDCGGFPDCLYHSLLYLLPVELAKRKIFNTNSLRNLVGCSLQNMGEVDNWKDDLKDVMRYQRIPNVNTWNDYISLVRTNLCGGILEIKALCREIDTIKVRVICANENGFVDVGNGSRIIRLYYIPSQFHYQALLMDAPKLEANLPSLPPNLSWKRPELSNAVDILCSPLKKKLVVSSYGGTGKTTFALMIGHLLSQSSIQEYTQLQEKLNKVYPGGVVWIKFGKDCSTPSQILEVYRNTISILDNNATYRVDEVSNMTADAAVKAITKLTEDRNILFILDDIWNSVNLSITQSISTSNGILITSRIPELANVAKRRDFEILSLSNNASFTFDLMKKKLKYSDSWIETHALDLQQLTTRCLNIPLLICLCSNVINEKEENLALLNQNIPELNESSITPNSIENQLYFPVIFECFGISDTSKEFNELAGLLSLALFPRTNFPQKKTICLYWTELFGASEEKTNSIFDNLVDSNLISINKQSQSIHLHDVLYDTVQLHSNDEKKEIWNEALKSTYFKYVKRKASKRGYDDLQDLNEWSYDLVILGPQDGYFFLNTLSITGISCSDSSPEYIFAKKAEKHSLNPNIMFKLFKYCSSEAINEEKFLKTEIPLLTDKSYRPPLFIERVHPWSYPNHEKLGLIHLVCIYGTPAMLKKLISRGVYLNTIAESNCTQRMPMEIVLDRKNDEMANLLIEKKHTGMDVASSGVSYAIKRGWEKEGESPWSCVTATQMALENYNYQLAIRLQKIGASTERMSGGISSLELAGRIGVFEYMEFIASDEKSTAWSLLPISSLESILTFRNLPDKVQKRCSDTLLIKRRTETKRQQAIEDGSAFTVTVKTLTGSTYTIQLVEDNLIMDLKYILNSKHGVPLDQQRLIHAGKQLEAGRTMQDYNIKEGSVINLVLRLRGGGVNYNKL